MHTYVCMYVCMCTITDSTGGTWLWPADDGICGECEWSSAPLHCDCLWRAALPGIGHVPLWRRVWDHPVHWRLQVPANSFSQLVHLSPITLLPLSSPQPCCLVFTRCTPHILSLHVVWLSCTGVWLHGFGREFLCKDALCIHSNHLLKQNLGLAPGTWGLPQLIGLGWNILFVGFLVAWHFLLNKIVCLGCNIEETGNKTIALPLELQCTFILLNYNALSFCWTTMPFHSVEPSLCSVCYISVWKGNLD